MIFKRVLCLALMIYASDGFTSPEGGVLDWQSGLPVGDFNAWATINVPVVKTYSSWMSDGTQIRTDPTDFTLQVSKKAGVTSIKYLEKEFPVGSDGCITQAWPDYMDTASTHCEFYTSITACVRPNQSVSLESYQKLSSCKPPNWIDYIDVYKGGPLTTTPLHMTKN